MLSISVMKCEQVVYGWHIRKKNYFIAYNIREKRTLLCCGAAFLDMVGINCSRWHKF